MSLKHLLLSTSSVLIRHHKKLLKFQINNFSSTKPKYFRTTGSYHSTCEGNMSDYTDPVVVCNEADIKENEMQKVALNDDTKILLIKQNGKLNAIGNKCPHYGAPLNTGALGEGRVRCPWHGACFNIETGDVEDFPGLDSLPCYKVEVATNGDVKVRANRKDLENSKRLKNMVKRCEDDARTFLIIGGGPSGAICAETLRQEGFTGRIVMLCQENVLPYDRVKVSKSMDLSPETLQFRTMDFYKEHSIEVMLGVKATKLDTTAKTVSCSNGQDIQYNKIYIATGCKAQKPPIPGVDYENVFTIRDIEEVNNIHKLIKPEMNAVCLGASFIALEAASYLKGKVKTVTLVGRENVPLKASFGEEIGQRVLKLYEDNQVNMIMNSGITEIIGNDNGCVTNVVLSDGSKLPCDILIMGTGTRFYTDFLKGSGVSLNVNGSIDTDMHLMTNLPDIYVGGDIANAPVFSIANQRATIGHYQLAQYHGRIAAINMAGKIEDLRAVPFFFTMVFGKGFRYSGYGKYSNVYVDGSLEELKFIAYFLDEHDNVIAVATCGRDPVAAQFAELQSQGKRLHRSDVVNKEEPLTWTKMLHKEPLHVC